MHVNRGRGGGGGDGEGGGGCGVYEDLNHKYTARKSEEEDSW